MWRMAKARAALMVVFICLSAAGLVYGQESDPCREAYLESGLSVQQMTYHQFQGAYGETVCATEVASLAHSSGR
jgi:nucleoside-diphosphate-sugar epimerase